VKLPLNHILEDLERHHFDEFVIRFTYTHQVPPVLQTASLLAEQHRTIGLVQHLLELCTIVPMVHLDEGGVDLVLLHQPVQLCCSEVGTVCLQLYLFVVLLEFGVVVQPGLNGDRHGHFEVIVILLQT